MRIFVDLSLYVYFHPIRVTMGNIPSPEKLFIDPCVLIPIRPT